MEKEEIILNIINKYYQDYHTMPSIREIMKYTNYKSTNSIYRYLKKLIEKGYLINNNPKKKLELPCSNFKNKLNNIKVINTNEFITIKIPDDNKIYIAYQIKDNSFIKYNIMKHDYLIIKQTKKLKDNDLGLFKINNEYLIMHFKYQDGFFILTGKTKEVLYKVNIIGKVVSLFRKNI